HAAPEDGPDVLVAVRAFRRYRMLMVTLERMGIRTPSLYAAAARAASRTAAPEPARAFTATAQFQGALALLFRMEMAGTLSATEAEALVSSLVAVPLNQSSQYQGALARWLAESLRRAIPVGSTLEDSVLDALAGPEMPAKAPVVDWEGQRYRADLAAA